MNVTFYGTRGSISVTLEPPHLYGGNSTCLHLESECLPERHWLVLDAGSGMVPLAHRGVKAGVQAVTVLFTHYHPDHTAGLFLSPWLYQKKIALHLYGPLEHGVGPAQMMQHNMQPPFFPVEYRQVASHVRGKGIENPSGTVMAIHSDGGVRLLGLDEFERSEQSAGCQLPFPGRRKYNIAECLIVRMFRSNHPERTISYRFEERPTGAVFVFLTDHENMAALPADLRRHLAGADLLVMDSQYLRGQYETATAGFGHGTADYCVSVAKEVGAKSLGLTHHDPLATDEVVGQVLAEGRVATEHMGYQARVFACSDYQSVCLPE